MSYEKPLWEVKLLGAPQAHRGQLRAHLRSRECWCALAALMLPEALGRADTRGAHRLSRQEIAYRFWAESLDPKHCLRQAVSSLRVAFGEECIAVDRTSIGVVPGSMVSDIGRIRSLFEASHLISDQSHRLERLVEAEDLICGPLLDGCVENSDCGFEWYAAVSAEVTSLLLKVLGEYTALLEGSGDLRGAFDSALKVLQLNPMNRAARTRVWELGRKTDQTDLLVAYSNVAFDGDMPSHIARRARKGLPLSSKELKHFSTAFEVRRERLSTRAKVILPRIALLTAPFTGILAARVCGASTSVLAELVTQGFIENDGEVYHVTSPVRACATRRTGSTVQLRVGNQLFAVCLEYLTRRAIEGTAPTDGLFQSPTAASLFLDESVSWLISQPAYSLDVSYLNLLTCVGMTDLAMRAVPWLRELLSAESRSSDEQYWTAPILGKVLSEARLYGEATECYLQALDAARVLSDVSLVGLTHDRLSFTYHHSNVPDRALYHSDCAIYHFESPVLKGGLAHIYRFRAEILTAVGNYSGTITNLELALNAFEEMGNAPLGVAECLYWKGKALTHLGNNAQAFVAFEAALRLRLDSDDITGVGHCLADMGYLRGLQGQYGEAKAHILHAMMLHASIQDEPGRIAALGKLGDVYLMETRIDMARNAYEEGLRYWESIGHERWRERFEKRMERTVMHLGVDAEAER